MEDVRFLGCSREATIRPVVPPIEKSAMTTTHSTAAPAWAVATRRFITYVSHDVGGGPRPWKLAWVINFQKGGTALFIAAMMAYYGNDSTAAWIYLALHGSYGIVWLIKDLSFPDPNWQVRVTLGAGISAFVGVLAPYWLIGWLLISRSVQPHYPLPDNAWFCLCTSLVIVGVAVMVAADAQKYFTLRLQRGLITDGMFRHVRHPNYLGEMMIYGAFGLMVWHWIPALILGGIWLGLFAVNMIMKEASMSRHEAWGDYKKRTWWLLPGLL